MTFFRLTCFAALLLPVFLNAQKIQYSRQTFPYSFADDMQMVTDVGGFHHVLRFKLGNKPEVHVFNPQLEYTGMVTLDFDVKEAMNIRIIPMERYYYLYSHVPGSTAHTIYKVGYKGDIEDKTPALQKLMDTLVPNSKATYQLQSQNNRLCLLSHIYYDELKKVGSTIVILDDEWKAVQRAVVVYPFIKEKETLQQVFLIEQNLFVLQTGIDEERGNTLQVVKANLGSDSLLVNTFATASHLYYNPGMQYSPQDSSLLVYAMLRGESNARRQQPAVFVSRLNEQLLETKPVTVHKTPAKQNILAGFLLLTGKKPLWLTPINQVLFRRNRNQTVDFRGTSFDAPTFSIAGSTGRIDESQIHHGQPTSVSFTVLNENDKVISDTIIENNGSYFDLQPRPHAQFALNNTAYLLFLQNFSAKQKGLVLVNADKTGRVVTTGIPVFDRYEYFVPQTKAKKDYFILPYRNKKEMGLVKVKISNDDK